MTVRWSPPPGSTSGWWRRPDAIHQLALASGEQVSNGPAVTPSAGYFVTSQKMHRVAACTGKVVWQRLAGTGRRYDSYLPSLAIRPKGIAYQDVFDGLVAIRDTR